MRDDYVGHRDPLTGAPLSSPEGWTEWDHALAYAAQVIEDYTDQYGLLAWEVDDEAVEIDAVKKIHKFKAAIDRATAGSEKKPYKPQPGEYFVPDLFSRRSGGEIQTFTEWVEKKAEEVE